MEKCRSKRCNLDVHVGWSFCPACGHDNRPKSFRPPIIGCPHRFAEPDRYCVICGDDFESANLEAKRTRIGVKILTLGGAFFGASATIKGIAFSGGGFGYEWINSWYEDSVILPFNILVRGNEVPTFLMVYGTALSLIGIAAIVAARTTKAVSRMKVTPMRTEVSRQSNRKRKIGTQEPLAAAVSGLLEAPITVSSFGHEFATASDDGVASLM